MNLKEEIEDILNDCTSTRAASGHDRFDVADAAFHLFVLFEKEKQEYARQAVDAMVKQIDSELQAENEKVDYKARIVLRCIARQRGIKLEDTYE